MTKGAISYQIKTLETVLGVILFRRSARGAALTIEGQKLLRECRPSYGDIEAQIAALRGPAMPALTVGVSTYFASRWLSPRLMSFMQRHPEIQLRLQPMIRLFDLEDQNVDVAIRWGSGDWVDAEIAPFMLLPAFPVGNAEALKRVKKDGIKEAIKSFTLLRDHDDSDAWTDWLNAADLPVKFRADTLIVPDPNVRVQSVIDGQGIALKDQMIEEEMKAGKLYQLSNVKLNHYGYFIARPNKVQHPEAVKVFVDWILGV